MINCKCSVDTLDRTECRALKRDAYIQYIREHRCGTKRCPFYKPREKDKTAK